MEERVEMGMEIEWVPGENRKNGWCECISEGDGRDGE